MRLEQSNFKATEYKIIESNWQAVANLCEPTDLRFNRYIKKNQIFFDNESLDTEDSDALISYMKSLLNEAAIFLAGVNCTISIVESDRIQYHNEFKNETQYRYSCRLHVEINFTSEADMILHSINNPFKP